MTIPIKSGYPDALDTDNNLFLVHDSLRVRLLRDYNPGDTTIYVEGDPVVFRRFPPTGLISLTEQCSGPDLRAVSFYYSAIDYAKFTIGKLELLEDFRHKDSVKPRRITNVTQNVMGKHHDLLKDALIAVEDFIGIKGTLDRSPLGPTMEGRINFLRKLVLSPKAYFSVDRTIGIVPLMVTFTDLSFRLGTDEASNDASIDYLWDFGDNTMSTISSISTVGVSFTSPSNAIISGCQDNVFVEDPMGGAITKTYCRPGIYDVTLTATNVFGSDSITIPGLINARVVAPDDAVVNYLPQGMQIVRSGTGIFNGDAYIPLIIRTPINSLISLKIPIGPDPHNPGHTYAGELLAGSRIVDPIASYTWALSDDLSHSTATPSTKASYSVGGLYDMTLRVDTEFGAYRITNYKASIDVVENQNLWMFNYISPTSVSGFEYGLISETFKSMPNSSFAPGVDSSFLAGAANSAQMVQEFNRNVGFAPSSRIASGSQGDTLLYYAGGRVSSAPIGSESIRFVSYNGFAQTFDSTIPSVARPWNWANFNSETNAYFLLGSPTTVPAANTSPINPTLTTLNIQSGIQITSALTASQFSNGADELLANPATFDGSGSNVYGNFSTYRSAWKSNVGYVLRNDNVGSFYRIRSFYQTSGTIGSPVQTLNKLTDMPGPTKLEGELLPMTPGLFFFNNSGSISAYNYVGGVWETGGPGVNSIAFRSLQDQTIANFDDVANPLVAVSDGDKRAYLSYDYSTAAFIKFDANSLTFSSMSGRPGGRQWIAGIY